LSDLLATVGVALSLLSSQNCKNCYFAVSKGSIACALYACCVKSAAAAAAAAETAEGVVHTLGCCMPRGGKIALYVGDAQLVFQGHSCGMFA
jgi:hypothetical protein